MDQSGFPVAVKAVMVDLDGTMLDTADDLAAAANAMLCELGIAERDPQRIKTFIGKGLVKLVKRCLTDDPDGEPDPALLERAMPVYERNYTRLLQDKTQPYPGVVDGLTALRHAGFHMACITNKGEKFTFPLLEATGLHSYFDLVLCGDTLPRRKPDPLPLLHACGHFGILPAEMLLIGDSLNDVQAARAAGSWVFCVPYGYNEGGDVRRLDCDAIVPTILEAVPLIRKA
jgi:phosphoglycolate phosphatase